MQAYLSYRKAGVGLVAWRKMHDGSVNVCGEFPSLRRNARQPIRSGIGGGALIVFGPVAAILLFFLFIGFVANFQWRLLGGIFLFGGAAYAVDVGRRMRTVDGWVLMQRDPRPPVIFLRPFLEDERLIYDGPVGRPRAGKAYLPPEAGKPHANQSWLQCSTALGPSLRLATGRASHTAWRGAHLCLRR